MRLYPLFAALLLLALAAGSFPMHNALAEDTGTVKITVLQQNTFANMTSYMLDTSSNKLTAINTSYVQVLSSGLKDLDANDNYVPVVVLNLNAPSVDLNNNQTVTYAYILSNVFGRGMVIGVADVNSTDNSLSDFRYYKLSPVTGDIAIVRTSYDISIQGDGYKLSIPLANYTDPKVILYTDSQIVADSISYVELRALTNPPSGYTLIRSGHGEASFTISASGSLHIWFDEEHDGGDVDLFVFDSSNQYYGDASASQDWLWLFYHCDRYLFADDSPWTASLDAHGNVKLVVKRYTGDADSVNWRVAATLGSSSTTTTQQPNPSNPGQSHTSTTTVTVNNPAGFDLSGVGAALRGGNNAVVYVIIVFFVLLAVLLLARK